MLDQVHGVEIYRSRPDTPLTSMVGVGDVLVGEAPIEGRATRPVAVWAADCAPVMLFDRHGVPVACHAGWRGLAAGGIDVAVAAGSRPVVAICLTAHRSIPAVRLLHRHGFAAAHLAGGMLAWRAAGFPEERG